MTAIVGLETKDGVIIGGDSAGVAGLSITIRSDVKVFENGPFIMGGTTSFRMLQLLQYKFAPPKQNINQTDMQYMVTDFIDAARKCFTDNGYGSSSNGGNFLVGYRNHLYNIDNDFQVGIPTIGYDAVGCGSQLCLGSMFSSKDKTPEARITLALDAASHFSGGVAPPYTILKQGFDKTIAKAKAIKKK